MNLLNIKLSWTNDLDLPFSSFTDYKHTTCNDVISAIVNDMIPWRLVRYRGLSSDTWFDEDYRLAERFVCRLERAAQKADPAAVTAWKTRCRAYHDLLHQKRESFWTRKVDSERSLVAVRRLVDGPWPCGISASDFQSFIRRQSRRRSARWKTTSFENITSSKNKQNHGKNVFYVRIYPEKKHCKNLDETYCNTTCSYFSICETGGF